MYSLLKKYLKWTPHWCSTEKLFWKFSEKSHKNIRERVRLLFEPAALQKWQYVAGVFLEISRTVITRKTSEGLINFQFSNSEI